jgi:pleckstrin domain-containing family G protein 5
MTDKLVIKLKEKENVLHCVYLNDFNMAIAAFTLHSNEAKSWYDGITKAKHIYTRLRQGSPFIDNYTVKYQQVPITTTTNNITNPINVMTNSATNINIIDNLSVKKSPLTSSIGSRVSSLNNSHSGSVELNESKTVSIDFEKTNSLSSDEGSYGLQSKQRISNTASSTGSRKLRQTSSNSLTVQTFNQHLGQSMPNLNMTCNPHAIVTNNTLLVPGPASKARSSNSTSLLSSQRGISYPPPSPTRLAIFF